MKNREFSGKVVIVTGSSRGIGKAVALEFAKRGASVVLNGRNAARLEQAATEIRHIHDHVAAVQCDVSTFEGGKKLIDTSVHTFGRIDILINNSGVSAQSTLAGMDPEVFRAVVEGNLMGSVCPAIAALPYLRITRGSLIFISSIAGIRGLPYFSAYSASKMALRAVAESLRIEEKPHHMHIGLIYVGFTENEPGKQTYAPDGSLVVMEPKTGGGIQTREYVARSVIRNVEQRKFITVLSPMGKALSLMQPLVPGLVERIIIKNLTNFKSRGR